MARQRRAGMISQIIRSQIIRGLERKPVQAVELFKPLLIRTDANSRMAKACKTNMII